MIQIYADVIVFGDTENDVIKQPAKRKM